MPDRLLEIRLFTLHPGVQAEFDRVSRDGTIPLMRRCDIEVLAFGPCLNDENGYYLVRGFDDEDDRVRRSQAVYATAEWAKDYETAVGEMIALSCWQPDAAGAGETSSRHATENGIVRRSRRPVRWA